VAEPGSGVGADGCGDAVGGAEPEPAAEADDDGAAQRPRERDERGGRPDAPGPDVPTGPGPAWSPIRPGSPGWPGRDGQGAAGTAPGRGPDPPACGGRIVMVTAPSMMYTNVAVTAMVTGGISSSGCARNAVAPLRNVAMAWSAKIAAAKRAVGNCGPWPMLALRRARTSAARRCAGVRPGRR
jgi:hypothetical protein